MPELLPFLKELTSLAGLSGYENPVRQVVAAAWQPLVDEMHISRLGSLHALRRGKGEAPRRSLLLTAHMDAIGLMVTGVDQGWLRVTAVGGLDPRILPSQAVTVHGRRDLPGVLVLPPDHLLPPSLGQKAAPLEYLLVDVGLPPNQVAQLVRVGDLVSFAQPPLELGKDLLAGHSMDNRASVAALTECLKELQHLQVAWDIWAVATTQEEETLGGAITSGFALHPDLAIVVDVTFGNAPGTPTHKSFPLGKGITLGWGPNIHPGLFHAMKELAERLEIPYKTELMPRQSGTDAMALQLVGEGIPTLVLGLPLRYMHTPLEVVCLKDIARAGRLMAEFAAQLDRQFFEKLSWDA